MAKDNVIPAALDSGAVLGTPHLSAICEIRRQLNQAYALVNAARSQIDSNNCAFDLLDMAEDILGDKEYINRLGQLTLRAEVPHV